MYSWVFRHLPGPLWLRIILSIGILAAVLFLLITFAFPWLSDLMKLTDSTVGTSGLKTPPA